MPAKYLSLSYADIGSAPKASSIGWINWDDFSLNPGESSSVEISFLDNFVLTFNITNTVEIGNGFTILSDTPIPNSAFGRLGYKNISGNIALEAFIDYSSSTINSSKFTLSDISIKDLSGNPVMSYSIVLASIQIDDNLLLSNSFNSSSTEDFQQFLTTGSDWNNVVWLGNTSSPIVIDTDKKNLTIYPISSTSGSPVYSTNYPNEVCVTISGQNSLPQFSIGIAVASITLQKIINGRVSNLDQFNLSIVGLESNTVTTTGSINGLQNEKAYVTGPVETPYSINESMAVGSPSTLDNYTKTVTWINNSPDGTPPPISGYLRQSIFVDVGDKFVATISNTPKIIASKANPNSGPESNNLLWINWRNFELSPNSIAQIIVAISSTLTLSFTIKNNGNSSVIGSQITDSAFGVSLYTGLLGNFCLEVVCESSPVTLTFDNIHLINNEVGTSFDYSLVLASIQYSNNAPKNYAITQQFFTNGSPWSQLAWAGNIASPNMTYSASRNVVTITTTNEVSGSPILISDPPTKITCTFTSSATPYTSRFAFGIIPIQLLPPSRGANIFKK